METSRTATQLKGLVGLVMIGLVIAILLGMYQKVFTSVTPVTIVSDRAGLQLSKGASVRAFGIPVGEVRSVDLDGDVVKIEVALDKESDQRIPSGVKASIRSTTVFGAKFVSLDVPRGPVVVPVESDEVLQATSVPIEVNDVFAHAIDLLDTLEPDKVNTTLTALAKATDGNGRNIGNLIDDTDTLLAKVNPSLGQLEADLGLAADVAENVDDLAPQALDTVDQLTVTTDMFAAERDSFRGILRNIVPAADNVGLLFRDVDEPLTKFNKNLLTPSRTLFEYAPAIPCTLDALIDQVDVLGEALGKRRPVADANASFLPSMPPYDQSNLPKLVTGVGPKCYQMPTATLVNPPHIQFDDGTKGIYTDDLGVPKPGAQPIEIYTDSIATFLGSSGAASEIPLVQNFLDAVGLGSPTPGATAAGTNGGAGE